MLAGHPVAVVAGIFEEITGITGDFALRPSYHHEGPETGMEPAVLVAELAVQLRIGGIKGAHDHAVVAFLGQELAHQGPGEALAPVLRQHRSRRGMVASRRRPSRRPANYRLRTRRRPRSTSCKSAGGVWPACSVKSDLFNVTRAVTFTTESRGKPVAPAGRNTLPGRAAKAVFDVMTAARTVASRLPL